MGTPRLSLPRGATLCLVCGVDSGPIRTFLWVFIGALVGASFLLAIWAWMSGRVDEDERAARLPLEAEGLKEE